MRIAILMSSQLRKFEPCWESVVKNIVNPLKEADHKLHFYGHFPPTPTRVEHFTKPHFKHHHVVYVPDPEWTEEQLAMTEGMRSQRHGIKGNLYQWNNMQAVWRMMQLDSIPFDLIVWTRPDLMIDRPIESNPKADGIYIPNHDHWHGYCDRFSYGPPEWMSVRLNILDYFLDNWYANRRPIKKRSWNPELVLKHLLDENEIPVKHTGVIVSRMRSNGFIIPAGMSPSHAARAYSKKRRASKRRKQ